MTQTPLDAAHAYIKRGWGVVPLYGVDEAGVCRCDAGAVCPEKTRGKHPHGTKRGWRTFTSGADVQAWWDDNPDDNLGIATGIESGIFVFDVDGAAGVGSVQAFVLEHGAMPVTRIVRTGSGGLHYFFRHPSHFVVYNSTSYIGAGIDIRGKGGQVVAPPSRSGRGPYEVIADVDVADAPDWLLTLLHEHSDRLEHGHKAEVKAAEHVDVELLPERVTTLRNQLVGMDEGRFRHFHALVAACYEAGFTQGETVSIVAPWCAAVGKFVGRVEQEVARTWGKLEAESQRANEWIDGLGDRPTLQIDALEGSQSSAMDVPGGVATPSELQATPEVEVGELPPSTWAPVDPGPILAGTYEPPRADLLPRSDGHCLLYRGLVHSFHGESESGKSMIAQGAVAQVLNDGGTAAYIDFESDAGSVYGRLRDMNVPIDVLAERFSYRHPDVDPFAMPGDRAAYADLASSTADIIVIDGVTDALGVFGAGTNDADEVSGVYRRFFRYVAGRTGAAVVLIDHVTKNADTRGRHAVGSQAKMNALDGAAYLIEVLDQPGQGRRGLLSMRVGKDRPGGVRGNGVSQKDNRTSKDRTEMAATVVVDSTQGHIEIIVQAPDTTPPREVEQKRARGHIDQIKEDLCSYMLETGQSVSQQAVIEWAKACGGVTEIQARQAFRELKDSPYWKVGETVRGHDRYVVAEPFSPTSEWLNGSTLVTLVDLGETSVTKVNDHLGVSPFPLGDTKVGGATEVETLVKSTTKVDNNVLVQCKACFAPTPEFVAEAFGGTCSSCARKAGLA